MCGVEWGRCAAAAAAAVGGHFFDLSFSSLLFSSLSGKGRGFKFVLMRGPGPGMDGGMESSVNSNLRLPPVLASWRLI